MDDIVQQVGALLLGAIPTMLLFVVLVTAYQFLVQGPLNKVLAERRARTEGAVENAHRATAQAEPKAAEYAHRALDGMEGPEHRGAPADKPVVAVQIADSDGPFDSPQHFRQGSALLKWQG